jgi:hypothetical protein
MAWKRQSRGASSVSAPEFATTATNGHVRRDGGFAVWRATLHWSAVLRRLRPMFYAESA